MSGFLMFSTPHLPVFSRLLSPCRPLLSPLAHRRWHLRRSQMFWGSEIKKNRVRARLPVCLRVSLSSGDNHSPSLVFLLLISVRRRMVGECQLSLKHLFPANNSLCRCLVLADGSPIVSSLLTQNNNAAECHLLVMPPPPIVSQARRSLFTPLLSLLMLSSVVDSSAA